MITIDHQYGMWMPVDASENDEDVGLAGLTPQEIGSLRGKMMIQPCMYVYIYIHHWIYRVPYFQNKVIETNICEVLSTKVTKA